MLNSRRQITVWVAKKRLTVDEISNYSSTCFWVFFWTVSAALLSGASIYGED